MHTLGSIRNEYIDTFDSDTHLDILKVPAG